MLATVPMRWRSSGVGIVHLGLALQHDQDLALLAHRLLGGGDGRGRPTVIGNTISGNSTVLRTGTTISASAGSGYRVGWPAPRQGIDVGRAHGRVLCGDALGSLITRQPLATPACGVP